MPRIRQPEFKSKLCIKCGKRRPIEHFWRTGKATNGAPKRRRSWCRKCMTELRRKYYHADPERFRGYMRKSRRKDLAAFNKRRRERYRALRRRIIDKYGGGCACCGEDKLEFLCVDHIRGGGTKEVRENFKDRPSWLQWLVKRKRPGHRILCYNCNMSMGHLGYCPHTGATFDSSRRRPNPLPVDVRGRSAGGARRKVR